MPQCLHTAPPVSQRRGTYSRRCFALACHSALTHPTHMSNTGQQLSIAVCSTAMVRTELLASHKQVQFASGILSNPHHILGCGPFSEDITRVTIREGHPCCRRTVRVSA